MFIVGGKKSSNIGNRWRFVRLLVRQWNAFPWKCVKELSMSLKWESTEWNIHLVRHSALVDRSRGRAPPPKKKQAGRNHLELWRPIKSAPKGKISNKIPWTSSAARRGAPQKKAGARFNYCELTAVRKIIFSLAQDAALSIHIHISQLERFAGFFNFVSLKKKKEGNYPRRPRTFSLATAPWHADDSIARKIFR